VKTVPNPQSQFRFLMQCPLGPSTAPHREVCAVANPNWSTPGLGVGSGSHVTVKVGVQLGELELDEVERCVHLRLPTRERLVELRCRGLEDRHAFLSRLVCKREIIEMLVDGGLLCGEADVHALPHLLHLINKHLDVHIHGPQFLLPTGEVVMIFQSEEVAESMNLIPGDRVVEEEVGDQRSERRG
jgi:hypothetical protein